MKIHSQTKVYLKNFLQYLICFSVLIQTALALEPDALVDNQECCEINYLQYSPLEAELQRLSTLHDEYLELVNLKNLSQTIN